MSGQAPAELVTDNAPTRLAWHRKTHWEERPTHHSTFANPMYKADVHFDEDYHNSNTDDDILSHDPRFWQKISSKEGFVHYFVDKLSDGSRWGGFKKVFTAVILRLTLTLTIHMTQTVH